MDTKSSKCVHVVEGGTNGSQYGNSPDGKDKPWTRYTCKKETKNIIYELGNSW